MKCIVLIEIPFFLNIGFKCQVSTIKVSRFNIKRTPGENTESIEERIMRKTLLRSRPCIAHV